MYVYINYPCHFHLLTHKHLLRVHYNMYLVYTGDKREDLQTNNYSRVSLFLCFGF